MTGEQLTGSFPDTGMSWGDAIILQKHLIPVSPRGVPSEVLQRSVFQTREPSPLSGASSPASGIPQDFTNPQEAGGKGKISK